MATYNEDGTNTFEPGESNDRAVPADDPAAPVDPPPDESGDEGAARHERPSHQPVPGRPGTPGRPAHPIAPGGSGGPHPSHPIAEPPPAPGPKHR